MLCRQNTKMKIKYLQITIFYKFFFINFTKLTKKLINYEHVQLWHWW
jgi:hypothetical protein